MSGGRTGGRQWCSGPRPTPGPAWAPAWCAGVEGVSRALLVSFLCREPAASARESCPSTRTGDPRLWGSGGLMPQCGLVQGVGLDLGVPISRPGRGVRCSPFLPLSASPWTKLEQPRLGRALDLGCTAPQAGQCPVACVVCPVFFCPVSCALSPLLCALCPVAHVPCPGSAQ